MVSQGFSNSLQSSADLLSACHRAPPKPMVSSGGAASMGFQSSRSTPAGEAALQMRALGDPAQKRSPLMCGYPSKKCWNWRVEKRNGELHKFCQYHREKANENQRRMEQRRKNGTPRGRSGSSNTQADAKSNAATAKEVTVKTERKSDGSSKTSPRSVDCIPSSLSDIFDLPENAALPFACDMDIDMDLSVDLAPTYMMTDETIEGEPSDLPVDLYEEDLFFLERFIAEISHGGI